MTGAIENLVRLHRWTLDEKRRLLSDLERLAQRLSNDITLLDEEIASEQEVASRSLEGAVAYPAFVAVAKRRRDKLVESLRAVEAEGEEARMAVQTAFQELKKYELAQAGALKRAKDKAARAEQLVEDELGLELHRRRGQR
ncbi:flagellar FliJ family protein [Algihabitans albus]|uniref:flagellar FliJ family protein n=1 Tax=Algihabitans albus TaxID=2164067 RepID=UPI000E5D8A1D|nr:flagellar FliJ family protein [Algihabitans albus]